MIVLDGATAADPSVPAADEYVDVLLAALAETIDGPSGLAEVVAEAIGTTAARLDLTPGRAPSSTVLILRERADRIEVAALGDSTAVLSVRSIGTVRVTDDRLAHVAPDRRAAYRERLRAGAGYDATHRQLLCDVQRAERAARNTRGGYWIAEADRDAGTHATIRSYPRHTLAWAVLATDGAQTGIDHHGPAWADIATRNTTELHTLLVDLQRWETDVDPDGLMLPRAKRHDDKTLITWAPSAADDIDPTRPLPASRPPRSDQ